MTQTQLENALGTDFLVVVLLAALVFLLLYLLPTFIAFSKRHPNRWVIFLVNFLFGFTILGWVGCLLWALNAVHRPREGSTGGESGLNVFVNDGRRVPIPNEEIPMAPGENQTNLIEQLDQLSKLRTRGALNEDEFAKLKGRLIAEHGSNESRTLKGSIRGPVQAQAAVRPVRVPNGYALALATFPFWGLAMLIVTIIGLRYGNIVVSQMTLTYGFAAFVLVTTLFLALRDLAVLDDIGAEPVGSGTLALFVLFYPLLGIYFWKRGTALREAYGDAIAFPRKHLLIWIASVAVYAVVSVPALNKSLIQRPAQQMQAAATTLPAQAPISRSTSAPPPTPTQTATAKPQALDAASPDLDQIAGSYRRADPLSDMTITDIGEHWHISIRGTSNSPNMPADCQIEADADLIDGQLKGTFRLDNLDRPGEVIIQISKSGATVTDADVADCGRGSDLTGQYDRVADR